jgi:D-beta-D-heptose 7-phosphate kinase/D-beta-D-heptose 1-phosphate adenosyltransferase
MKSKILSAEALKIELDRHRAARKKVVFTNGCFDLLHVGHVRYLAEAKACGDILVVGLNSDSSVKKIKGEKRPVVSQRNRAEVLAGLGCVDYVTVFDEPDPLDLIEKLRPDILVKGADWPEDRIAGAREVRQRGGDVVRIEFVPGESTTEIIKRITAAYCPGGPVE